MKKIIILLILVLTMVVPVIWFGFYNVAANDKHFSITTQILELVRNRSISARSNGIEIPDLDDAELINEGAKNYADMCTGCHLAPGMEVTELHSGLYPKPPVFNKSGYQNSPAAQFWVIKNGIKMTGMPAWSPPHTDEQVWGMVAFIRYSKNLSPEQYQSLLMQPQSNLDKNAIPESKGRHNHSH